MRTGRSGVWMSVVALVVGAVALVGPAQASVIHYAGSLINAPEVPEWRTVSTPKAFDIDGDDVYGTFASLHFQVQGNFSGSTISYVSSGSQYRNAGYTYIDHLPNPAIDSQAGIALSGHTFQVNATLPRLRVGVMRDVLAPGEYAADTGKSFQLVQAGNPSNASIIVGSPTGNGAPEMYFFDIFNVQAGEQYSILGFNTPSVSGQSGYVSSVSWDRVTTAPGAANTGLWSVDMHGTGNGRQFGQDDDAQLMSGVEPNAGRGNIWNSFGPRGYDGASTHANPSMALKDSDGQDTGVVFQINGNVQLWTGDPGQGGDPLLRDYLFLDAGQSADQIAWEITGLDPLAPYELYMYGGATRSMNMTIDQTNEAATFGAAGHLFRVNADAQGRISGIAGDGPAGGEQNWSGFQLAAARTDIIPEPTTLALLGLSGLALLRRRRRS